MDAREYLPGGTATAAAAKSARTTVIFIVAVLVMVNRQYAASLTQADRFMFLTGILACQSSQVDLADNIKG